MAAIILTAVSFAFSVVTEQWFWAVANFVLGMFLCWANARRPGRAP